MGGREGGREREREREREYKCDENREPSRKLNFRQLRVLL